MSWQQLLTVVQLMLLLHSSMVTCRTVEVNILSPTSWTPGGGDDSNSHSKAAYLSQLSEYLFDHSPGTFFRFMDHLCSSSSSSSSSSINTTTTTAINADEDDYWQPSTFDAAAEALIPTTLHSLMHTMTTVGHYTPTIQFFHSLLTEQLLAINSTVLSPPCGPGQPFIILTHGSTVVCNPQDLLQRLADDAVDDDSDTIRDNDNDDDDDIKVNVDLNGVHNDLNPFKTDTSLDDIIYQNIYNYIYLNNEIMNSSSSISKLIINLSKKQKRKVLSNYYNGYLYDKSINNLSSQHVIAMLQHYAYHGVLYTAINDVISNNNQR